MLPSALLLTLLLKLLNVSSKPDGPADNEPGPTAASQSSVASGSSGTGVSLLADVWGACGVRLPPPAGCACRVQRRREWVLQAHCVVTDYRGCA